ncbi:MAG TPA: adenylosuccinate synthetase, partial [Methanocella sp.]|nr:adenylosuccinate synthetase [Methanocella sp.]
MVTTIVVGGFFGDEGKGKIVAHIAYTDHPSIIARGGVGPNAGHTVVKDGVKHGVRMIPSGFIYDSARLLIGAGVLVDPVVLEKEVSLLNASSRLGVDYRCSIIEAKHIEEDQGTELLARKIGTTGTGCGPANKDRVMRSAKQAKDIPSLGKYLTDVAKECNDAIDRGESVIIEGSQGFGISLYYGTYPFVTSKDTSASQLAADVGVGPT